MMLDYEDEAAAYDATRGGEPRAAAAAAAIGTLLPQQAQTIVDAGCGTGIVTAMLQATGRRVLGLDRAARMLGMAAHRLNDGAVVRADATRLPVADSACDAVIMIWLLHLLGADGADQVMRECARILRPGGTLITTADKDLANFANGSDVTEIVAGFWPVRTGPRPDGAERLGTVAAGVGLAPAAYTTFIGHGQGRSPRDWQSKIRNLPWHSDSDPKTTEKIRQALAGLPEQTVPRADPRYLIVSFTRL